MRRGKVYAAPQPRWHRPLQATVFLVLLVADQFTKYLAATNWQASPLIVLHNILEFTYWENTGAAFSSFQGGNSFFIVANTLLLAAVLLFFLRIPGTAKWYPLQYSLLVLLVGGAGNLTDRVLHGYVIDFIYFVPLNFPIFNLADCYISLSIILISILVLFKYKEGEIASLLKTSKTKQ